MAYGDSPVDKPLRDAWHAFCDQLKVSGDLVFKDYNPATSLQRADGFRYLTQNLSQAFDLALETKDTKYPMIHAFCAPDRKLGMDNADFVYLQAWIDGSSVYKITGTKGSARWMNFTVQGPRPATDAYHGRNVRNLHEPFGDTPEANLFGHELKTEWDGSFVLYIGGPKREPNWLPTTPGSRKLFLRQGFDKWEEESAQYRIERIGMDSPRPMPTHETILEAVSWAQDFLHGCMNDWPDLEILIAGNVKYDRVNEFASLLPIQDKAAEERDARRGRTISHMRWRIAPDEAVVIEFKNYDGFWMFTNMGVFGNSMDYLYRNVSYTPSRATVDADDHVRLIMAHEDPGYHNWFDTQGFEEGYATYRNLMSRKFEKISTRVLKLRDLEKELPHSRKITREERVQQLRQRFDGIRRRYRI
jgi:hypothetical protein